MNQDPRLERLFALQRAARHIADPSTPLGKKARTLLSTSSGLSEPGVDYALGECLEHRAGRAALSQLTRRAQRVPRAHVLLSAHVFVAAYRAIALALAQSDKVTVRASRREPHMAALLHEGSDGAFELVETLDVQPGEHVWAYGADRTLDELRRTLPAGARLHAHGSGMGIAVVAERALGSRSSWLEPARELALDTVAFDQRGCLSPRLVLLEGSRDFCERFADALAAELSEAEVWVPRGPLSADERADAVRYENTMAYVGGARRAGQGLVVLDHEDDRLFVPPVGRYLQLVRTQDALERIGDLGPRLTTVGVLGDEALPGRIQARLGPRRVVDLGKMQIPPLDGPVDLRSGWEAEQL